MINSNIKQFLGLETVQEQLERYSSIQKSFDEVNAELDQLAQDFFIEKSRYSERLNDPDNYTIQWRIHEKYNEFIDIHKSNIRSTKKKFDRVMKEKNDIEKSLNNHKYITKRPDGKGGIKYIYDIPKHEEKTNFKTELDYAKRVNEGIDSLKRLSPAEEQGLLLGGKRNVEATIIVGAKKGTGEDIGRRYSREEQEVQITREQREKNFKEWFGNSKVVDENGKPLVVYHGTNSDFSEFKKENIGKRDLGFYGKGFYFSKTQDYAEDYAKEKYGMSNKVTGSIIPVYLKIEKPLHLTPFSKVPEDLYKFLKENPEYLNDNKDETDDEFSSFSIFGDDEEKPDDIKKEDRLNENTQYSELITMLSNSEKITSALIKLGHDGIIVSKGMEYLVFNSNQIKSAIGNNGNFDSNSNDITKSTINELPEPKTNFLGEEVWDKEKGVTKYADFLLFNEMGQLLLLKRSQWEQDNKDAWVIPGGHVDEGETCQEAARRELSEESGIWVPIEQVKPLGQFKDSKADIKYFTARVNSKEQLPILQLNETQEYKWIDLWELIDYPMVYNMRDNICKLLNINPKQEIQVITKAELKEKYGEEVGEYVSELVKGKDYNSLIFRTEARKTDKQYTKEEVDYVDSFKEGDHVEENSCDRCEYYRPKQEDNCLKVIGKVSHNGHCKLWEHTDTEKSYTDTLQKAYLEGIISEDVIEKAWNKHPIGTVVTRKDGTKWKKVSETGNSKQDWKPLHAAPNSKSDDQNKKKRLPSGEESDGKQPKLTKHELSKHAQETSETALRTAIKESPDSEVRETAHEELDRREKEEKVQEEGKKGDEEGKVKVGKGEFKRDSEIKDIPELESQVGSDFEVNAFMSALEREFKESNKIYNNKSKEEFFDKIDSSKINTKDLTFVQSRISKDLLDKKSKDKDSSPIQVFKVGDKIFVYDGNHRAISSVKNKDKEIDAKVYDMTKHVNDKDFEWNFDSQDKREEFKSYLKSQEDNKSEQKQKIEKSYEKWL